MIKKYKKFGIIHEMLICLLIIIVIGTFPTVNAETTFESFPELTTGDYFNYEVKEKGLVDFVGNTLGGQYYTAYENANVGMFIFKITEDDEVTIEGQKYDCVIAEVKWKASFTLEFKEGSTEFDDDKLTFERDYFSKNWLTKSEQETVRLEDTNYIKMSFTKDNKPNIGESETITKYTYKNIGDEYSYPLKVGKSWSSTTETILNTTERYRINNEDWEEVSSEETETKIEEYEVLSKNQVNVPAGSFNCLKLKNQEVGISNFGEAYIEKNGILVKMLSYENGTLAMTIELKDYKMKNEIREDSNGFKIIYFIPILGIVAVIGIIGFTVHRKKEEIYIDTRLPIQKTVQKSCSICGNDLEYVEDFNDYYCWICEKYRSEQFQESIPNKCPQCEMDMEYIEDYSDYYCWECDMYQEEM